MQARFSKYASPTSIISSKHTRIEVKIGTYVTTDIQSFDPKKYNSSSETIYASHIK